ncbi:AbrB/MazE/SpoVT family DNA-binding domain-containing protein [Phenylobacterium sp.]|uniref:AbrB/MazE/SpoVT family DNA-binding domain-containing protein n=1 Tax=Phenylobacterium sp. TaxID=1871053 RepID=UPI0025D08DC9|nr:AbrB/MazE/SpoVT family DNA-binding domain-containing protein [Phenylobacterium sp.]MBX3485068.1 AbrB/MazE/SpoVT family DNA-binding domain-containing protein [Phenylobacterium sp.]MCW5758889.1 AbrB/MazE/SpoVT family DNA-binding domain-containing protein [Phenylobacterium sp.]
MNAPLRQTTVISTKGQVILPKAIRDKLRWEAGARLVVKETASGVLITRENPFPPTTLGDVVGRLRYDGPAKTIEAMHEGVVEAAAEDDARIMREYRKFRDRG